MAALRGLWQAYNSALATHPLAIKTFTATSLSICGDLLAQYIQAEDKRKIGRRWTFDFYRTARFASYALFIGGPWGHYFYTWLDLKMPGTLMPTVFKKMVIDQLIVTPPFTAFFFAAMGFLEGSKWADIKTKIKVGWAPTLATCYMLWPIAHIINFRYVPSSQRVLYLSTISIGWATFLSTMSNKAAENHHLSPPIQDERLEDIDRELHKPKKKERGL